MNNAILEWLNSRQEAACLRCENVSLDNIDKWNVSDQCIEHSTKRFFSIIGVSAVDNITGEIVDEQPRLPTLLILHSSIMMMYG